MADNILDQLIDVLMRPHRYEILECDGELFIRDAAQRRARGRDRRSYTTTRGTTKDNRPVEEFPAMGTE